MNTKIKRDKRAVKYHQRTPRGLNISKTKSQAMADISEDCIYNSDFERNWIAIEYQVLTAIKILKNEL